MKGTFMDRTRTKKKKKRKENNETTTTMTKRQLFKNDFLRYIFMHIFIG